ncbi:MAG: TonB-dependent receptor [Cytophagales bacterium]|nr:MAG: TonB-dependent receptor [Cytophagales bacterium]
MKKLLLFLCIICLSQNIFAQSSAIKGKVQTSPISDQAQPEDAVGVTVSLVGTLQGTVTDLDGNFIIRGLSPGRYDIIVSLIGYVSDTVKSIQVQNNLETILSTITLKEEKALGLEEVEIFANMIDGKRQPPTPIATISQQEIEEKMGAQDFPEMLKSTPGVFVNTGGGSWGDSQIRVRGFTSENTATLFNGIPVNDMESGRVFWANWNGLQDVTRNQQVQRGLGVSKLAISSVGGTMNIITNPAEHRKGARMSQTFSNRAFQHGTTWKYSTGLSKSDWAATAVVARRWGEGFREGTNVDSWSYFLSVHKRIKSHQFILTGFGVLQNNARGGRATDENYATVGRTNYNPNWGTYRGGTLNGNVNRSSKPMISLNHYWDITSKITLSTAVYYSWADAGGSALDRTSGTGINIATSRFDILPNPTSINSNSANFQVDFDRLESINSNNFVTIPNANGSGIPFSGNRSKYIIRESVNNHQWAGAITTLNADINDKLSITAGLDWRWYRGFHYQQVTNLLGGDFWLDVDRNNNNSDNNLAIPNRVTREGDRIGYDYNGTVRWLGAFVQAEYSPIKNLDLFLTANYVYNDFQRNGKWWNGKYPDNSLGLSPLYTFQNYTLKAGANYKITGRHNAFLNVGRFTRAPFFQNAFVDNRVTNITRSNLNSEEISSIELGYGYRAPKLAINVNAYHTEWRNHSYTQGFLTSQFGTATDFVNFQLSNVNALHRGIEVDFNWQATAALTVQGMVSLGDWRYLGNPTADVLTDPISSVPLARNATIYANNLRVGGVPQTTSSLNLRYRGKKFWYAGINGNYYGGLYSDFNAETRLTSDSYVNALRPLPDAITFDMFAGKSWRLDKKSRTTFQLRLNLSNITDRRFIIDSNEPTPGYLSPFSQYYFGRTYTVTATMSL